MKYNIDKIRNDEYNLREVCRKAERYDDDRSSVDGICKWILIGIIVLFIVIAGLMILLPNYGVWKAELEGKAKLAEAEYSKQVLVQEAQSNLEAEKLNAESEVERAKGAAEARRTEGLGMSAEQYIQYLWVKKLDLSQSKTIYLPTEGGLPKMTYETKE